MIEKNVSKTKQFLLFVIAIGMVLAVYSNHFKNAFEFDDDHTIVNNLHIRDIKNIPSFFTDATTTSTLPASQAYRPGVTTLNALDFYFGGQATPDPFYFHISIFISFLLLGLALFKFTQKILQPHFDEKTTFWFSFISTLWFWLHTANSATINYIIARADSFSTFMVVVAFCVYLCFPKTNKFYLYLIPVVIGFLVKEPAVMFIPIFIVYKILFEQKESFSTIFTKNRNKLWLVLKECSLPILLVLGLVLFSRSMTPEIWTSGTTNVFGYALTQPFVILHYFNNFFIPVNLVIDTDWTPITNYFDDRVITGTVFLIALVVLIFKTSKNHKPIAFGVSWFLLALLPTSSFVPLAEVLNDHRPFFGYIGLFVASAYVLAYVYTHYHSKVKPILMVAAPLVLLLNAYGTYQQNTKWKSPETIWQDATINAPRNGRAWMNYGNQLMARADYAGAENAYKKTIELWPLYPHAFINLGILKNAQNLDDEAEANFKKGIALDSITPEFYMYYSKLLLKKNRIPEAKILTNKGLQLSPEHAQLLEQKKQLEAIQTNGEDFAAFEIRKALALVKSNPTHETYLNLSLLYHNNKQYPECITACQKALELKPDYALAYNNICSAYIQLEQWEKAIEAGKKGLAIDPSNKLLTGNLNYALSKLKK